MKLSERKIYVAGPSKVGKTTLVNVIGEKHGCNIFSSDVTSKLKTILSKHGIQDFNEYIDNGDSFTGLIETVQWALFNQLKDEFNAREHFVSDRSLFDVVVFERFYKKSDSWNTELVDKLNGFISSEGQLGSVYILVAPSRVLFNSTSPSDPSKTASIYFDYYKALQIYELFIELFSFVGLELVSTVDGISVFQ